jgi:hypothetical protein
MPARIQDVQPTDCNGKFGYSFTLWDEKGKIAVTIGFATSEDANEAAALVRSIISRAILVAASPCV